MRCWVLLALLRGPPADVDEIARRVNSARTGVHRQTVTDRVAELRRAGVLERVNDPNEKAPVYALTEVGRLRACRLEAELRRALALVGMPADRGLTIVFAEERGSDDG